MNLAYSIASFLLFFVSVIQPAFCITTYPLPEYCEKSRTFELAVSGTSVPVEFYRDRHIAHFLGNEKMVYQITIPSPIKSFSIHPKNLNLKGEIDGNILRVTIDPSTFKSTPSYLIFKINGLENLVVIADPPESSVPESNASKYLKEADPTGKKLSTSTIQAAIDTISKAGGGTLFVPRGTYLVQSLMLKDGVTLYLEAGAVIRGSNQITDYTGEFAPRGNSLTLPPIIEAKQFKNIAVKGYGWIDANQQTIQLAEGRSEKIEEYGKYRRKTIHVVDGKNFQVEGVTARDGTGWSVFLDRVENANISKVKVISPLWHWADGIDVCGRDVTVDRCFVYCGDDSFCSKAMYSNYPIYNIRFQNSVVYTSCAGAKVGMQALSDHSKIYFDNMDIIRAGRGMVVEHTQHWTKETSAAPVHDIFFSNIRAEEIIRLRNLPGYRSPIHVKTQMPAPIRDVYFKNIIVDNFGPEKSSIMGYDSTNSVSNVVFENLVISNKKITSLEEGDFKTRNIGEVKFIPSSPVTPVP